MYPSRPPPIVARVATVILGGLVMCLLAAVARADEAKSGNGNATSFYLGMTVSCFRWGPGEWDGPLMPDTLEELQALGVNAIAIHPYADIAADGGVRYRRELVTPATLAPLALASQRGMITLLKPHLAYWRSPFSWRGEITFTTESQWQRFFAEYRAFILHQAELAEEAGATVFAVGTELQGTLSHEAEWREIIAAVRAVYSGKLTYAANWDVYRNVPFWDALDLVGVQAYFPLSEAGVPSDAELAAGWAIILAQLRTFSGEVGRPILLTELGYARSTEAARYPWRDTHVGERSAGNALKLRCMRVALPLIEAEPSIVGVFLWKWFPARAEVQLDREFTLQFDAMRRVLREAWGTR